MLNKRFIDLAIKKNVIQFGEFSLKSKRVSPFFFNCGLFNEGSSLLDLAHCYAEKIVELKSVDFDIILGPAYKGIPIGALVTVILFQKYGINKKFCYNRKEIKNHGEKGRIVGNSIRGKKILIVDDVITAGTAIVEIINMIKDSNSEVTTIVVGLDREEIMPNKNSSSMVEIKKRYSIQIFSIAKMSDLISYLEHVKDSEKLRVILDYRRKFGPTPRVS